MNLFSINFALDLMAVGCFLIYLSVIGQIIREDDKISIPPFFEVENK